jgi:Ca2+-binding RTX toxin-like protein
MYGISKWDGWLKGETMLARVRKRIGIVLGSAVLVGSSLATTADAARPMCLGREATIVGTKGPDKLTGTSEEDVIVGLRGDDIIYGGSQDDYICGSGGADKLYGQEYDDVLHGGTGNDKLFGGPGDNEGDSLIGGAGNDRFTAGDNVIGDATPDTLDYSSAADSIRVNVSTQTITGAGHDFIVDPGEVYEILGSRYNDVFKDTARLSAQLSPQLSGQNGDDSFLGSRRLDDFVGGAGSDTMYSYGGNDVLVGGTEGLDPVAGSDYMAAGAGDDGIFSDDGAGDDEVLAAGGADRCWIDEGDTTESCEDIIFL